MRIAAVIAFVVLTVPAQATDKPNVVLVITDDQGYGDIRAHGNSMINTPALDRLWSSSVRLTKFHVDPTCAPTRSALMSGRYSTRTGVWHTIMGRSLMSPNEVTVAEAFKANGYATGMFGKWHLGDNYPCRPEDQGFSYTVRHGGGGVGQGPDYWGNDYFDDTYWRNGKPEQFQGYCTDIWFDEGIQFIKRNKDKPFFAYISTNAPHGPLNVDAKYSKPYTDKGVPANMAKFYGMITNIDENVTRLRKMLDADGLSKNTILIFMTDNGTANGIAGGKPRKKNRKKNRAAATDKGWKGFNAGMRGKKGSEYDGGHRVPFFIHWPDGKLTEGRDVDQLCAHVDVLPTLMDLCGLEKPDGPKIDGTSLKSIIYGDKTALRDRTMFTHSQRIHYPEKWRKASVMTQRWRLIGSSELYDIQADPGQTENVAGSNPEIFKTLNQAYDDWWDGLKPKFDEVVRIGLGAAAENPARLMSHDWLVKSQKDSAWNQNSVKRGHPASGPWAVDITQDGKYRVELYRWPKHLERSMDCKHAKLKIGDTEVEKAIAPGATVVAFELDLKKGPSRLQSWLTNTNGKQHGAYFVWVRRL
jgi:arylsulfatase A-like enzyme